MPIVIKKSKKIKLNDAQKNDLINLLDRDYTDAHDGSSAFRDSLVTAQEQSRGLLQKKKEKESWQSNISLPLTRIYKFTVISRLFEAMYESPAIVNFLPTGPEDIESTEKLEKWFNNKLKNYTKHFEKYLDLALNKNAQDGLCVFFTDYEKEIKKINRVETFELTEEDVFDDMSFINKCSMIIDDIFKEDLLDIEPSGEHKYKVKYKRKTSLGSNKQKIIETAIVNFWPDLDEMLLDVDIEENSIEYDGAIIKPISIDNIYFDPNTEDFQSTRYIQMRFWTNKYDIEKKWKEGIYDLLSKEDIEQIKKTNNDSGNDENLEEIRDAVASDVGFDSRSTNSGSDYSPDIRARLCFYRYDIDNDNVEEEIVVTYLPGIKKICNIRMLGDIYRHGERPFTYVNYEINEEDTIFGYGVPELLKDIQEEADVLHNLSIDYTTLTSIPFGTIRGGSPLNGQAIKIEPGVFIPIDEQGDLAFPTFSQRPNFGLAEVAMLDDYGKKLVGTSDAMLGQQQFSRTPVGSTLKLLAESNVRIRLLLRRFLRGFKEALKQAYKLERIYAPPEQVFRVIGDGGKYLFPTITRKELQTLPDFEFNTSIDSINKVFLREAYILLFQQLVNPLLIQMGLIQPQNIYNICIKLFSTYDIPDYHKLITAPVDNPVMNQKEETMRMMQGEYVDVNPMDDDTEHILEIDEFRDSDGFGYFPEERVKLLVAHYEKHKFSKQKKELAMMQMQQQMNKMLGQGGGGNAMPQPQPGGIQRPKINPNMPVGGGMP